VSETGTREIGSTIPGHYGASESAVSLSAVTVTAAWNVQGDGAQTTVVVDVARLLGIALPVVPGGTSRADALLALWLGPRSWLLVENSPQQATKALAGFGAKRDALNLGGAALFDVSASRVAYTVRGAGAATVLARGCPLDFDARAFAPGSCAQSMLGRVGALFYRHAQTPAITVMVARSLAGDVWRALCIAAATDGYDVAAPAGFDAG
jgi:sarcosine oxidase, subunit gamma